MRPPTLLPVSVRAAAQALEKAWRGFCGYNVRADGSTALHRGLCRHVGLWTTLCPMEWALLSGLPRGVQGEALPAVTQLQVAEPG